MNIYTFFYHSLPPEGELTLEELHFVVRDVWLARLDSELEAERAARRKGRPKSTKEQKLEEQKLRETEVYRTGMGECIHPSAPFAARSIQVSEVIDLTHPTNVELFRKWDQAEAAYVQQLRFIRISSASPETVVLSRPGRHPLLEEPKEQHNLDGPPADSMDTDDAPLLLEPPSRFASTIQTMDGA